MALKLRAIAHAVLAVDRAILAAIKGLFDYQPANSQYSLAQLVQLEETLAQAELSVANAQEALDRALAVRIETSHAFHNAIIGAKEQVIAQYGNNSFAVERIGLKRKSEHKHPTRRQAVEA